MIAAWTIAVICMIGGLAFGVWVIKESESETRYITAGIASIIIGIALAAGILFWLYGTESGARAIKDTQSNLNGGIERTITVYDIDGCIIQTYSGKFDVDYDSNRIKFDDEDGKRHIIYYTTGTVIIDEE